MWSYLTQEFPRCKQQPTTNLTRGRPTSAIRCRLHDVAPPALAEEPLPGWRYTSASKNTQALDGLSPPCTPPSHSEDAAPVGLSLSNAAQMAHPAQPYGGESRVPRSNSGCLPQVLSQPHSAARSPLRIHHPVNRRVMRVATRPKPSDFATQGATSPSRYGFAMKRLPSRRNNMQELQTSARGHAAHLGTIVVGQFDCCGSLVGAEHRGPSACFQAKLEVSDLPGMPAQDGDHRIQLGPTPGEKPRGVRSCVRGIPDDRVDTTA